MSAQYPSAAGTDANLFVAVNNLSTALTDNPLSSGATTVNVASTTGFPTAGYITIESEAISYTNVTGTSFTGCTRGADGTTAASHVTGTTVFHDVVAAHHNVLKDEVKAVETDLVGTMAAITPVTATSTATSVLNRVAMFCKRFVDLNSSGSNWYDAFTWLSGLDQTATVTGTSATSLKNLFDQIAHQLKNIAGTTNWYDSIAKNLTQLLPLSGGTMSGAIAMGSNKITGLTNGSSAADAAAFGQLIVFTDWASYTPTFVGLGTVSNTSVFWRQLGNTVFVRGYTKCGTVTASAVTLTLPNSTVINTSHLSGSSTAILGFGYQLFSGAGPTKLSAGIAAGPLVVFSDGSDTSHTFVAMQDTSSVFNKDTGSAMFLTNDGFAFEFSYSI